MAIITWRSNKTERKCAALIVQRLSKFKLKDAISGNCTMCVECSLCQNVLCGMILPSCPLGFFACIQNHPQLSPYSCKSSYFWRKRRGSTLFKTTFSSMHWNYIGHFTYTVNCIHKIQSKIPNYQEEFLSNFTISKSSVSVFVKNKVNQSQPVSSHGW